MSVSPSTNDFNVVDHTGLFDSWPATNRLLISLGMFNESFVDVPQVSFEYLVKLNEQHINPVERYGSNFVKTVKSKASLHQIELPYWALNDSVSVQDWQGRRVPGENRPMQAEDVQLDYLMAHRETFLDTLERSMADALFRNIQATKYTAEPNLDLASEFGLSQQTQDIAFGTAGTDVDGALDDIQIKIRAALREKNRYLKKVVCVCGSQYFKTVKSNPTVKAAFAYVQPFDPRNIIHNYQEVLPAMQSFEYNNILFVLSADPLHGIPTNEGYYFPLLFKESNVYKHFAGSASRHATIAQQGGKTFHQYVLRDPKWQNQEVVGEMSALMCNYLPNVVIHSTNQ